MGGVLCQRSRCWYYRHPRLRCFKDGGDSCPARDGDNHFGVAFDLGPCVAAHPSSIALALLAYEATFDTTTRRAVPIAELYGDGRDPSRDHQLDDGELLTMVTLPPPTPAGARRLRAADESGLGRVAPRGVRRPSRRGRATRSGWPGCASAAWPTSRSGCRRSKRSLPAARRRPTRSRTPPSHAIDRASPLEQTRYKLPMIVGHGPRDARAGHEPPGVSDGLTSTALEVIPCGACCSPGPTRSSWTSTAAPSWPPIGSPRSVAGLTSSSCLTVGGSIRIDQPDRGPGSADRGRRTEPRRSDVAPSSGCAEVARGLRQAVGAAAAFEDVPGRDDCANPDRPLPRHAVDGVGTTATTVIVHRRRRLVFDQRRRSRAGASNLSAESVAGPWPTAKAASPSPLLSAADGAPTAARHVGHRRKGLAGRRDLR